MKKFYSILIILVIILGLVSFVTKSIEFAALTILVFGAGVLLEFYISTTPFSTKFTDKDDKK